MVSAFIAVFVVLFGFAILATVIVLQIHVSKRNEQARQARWNHLVGRFGPDIAARIFARQIWQGATSEMIVESLGRPIDIDEKILKTKSMHVFKYYQRGRNRFGLRVTLENGIVVGWDEKL